MAVQLAVADGARVIGTASENEQERLRGLGVEPVVYGDGLLERIRALAPEASRRYRSGRHRRSGRRFRGPRREPRTDATIVSSARSKANGIQALGGGPGADPGKEIRSAARLELIRRVEAGSCECSSRRRTRWSRPLQRTGNSRRSLARQDRLSSLTVENQLFTTRSECQFNLAHH